MSEAPQASSEPSSDDASGSHKSGDEDSPQPSKNESEILAEEMEGGEERMRLIRVWDFSFRDSFAYAEHVDEDLAPDEQDKIQKTALKPVKIANGDSVTMTIEEG